MIGGPALSLPGRASYPPESVAKILVIDAEEKPQVPFLRGSLTRSLQDAGVSFETAYSLASRIREDLNDSSQVTTRALQALVIKRLRALGNREEATTYSRLRRPGGRVMVEEADGRLVPFSRARHERRLACCGLSVDEAGAVTQLLYRHLLATGPNPIPVDRVGGITHGCVRQEIGEEAAYRYLVWTHFSRSGRPLILLLSGTAGCGKSTTATMLANRLDIVRTQSTDMLREIMRVMVPERLLPVLHRSSFDAWKALPGHAGAASCTDAALADGFRAQAELLSVASEAVVHRALRERVSFVLEGVHVNPDFAGSISHDPDAVIETIMLAVLKPKRLRRYIRGRGRQSPHRRAERYLENFDDIWRLQAHLLDQADQAGIPIIANNDREEVFRKIMLHVIDRLSVGFAATPREVFGGQILQGHRMQSA